MINMQRTRTLKNPGRVIVNLLFPLLFFSFLLGMFYGVLLVARSETLFEQFHVFTGEYVGKLRQQSALTCFISSFCAEFFFLFAVYLFGFSAIGQPGSVFLLFFKGLGLGAFMGNFYASHGFRGILFCLIMILPETLIALFALFIACRESIRLSNLFFTGFLPEHEKAVTAETVKLYHVKFLVLTGILFCSALLDSLITVLFARFFEF